MLEKLPSLIRLRADLIRRYMSRAISSPVVPGFLRLVGIATQLAGDLAPDQELGLRVALALVGMAAESARRRLTGTAASQPAKPGARQLDDSDSGDSDQ